MPRMSTIRYFKSRQAYYTQFKGHQYPLAKGPNDYPDGPTYKAACKEFDRIVEESGRTDSKDGIILRNLCEFYMGHNEQSHAASTQRRKHSTLRPFLREFGDKAVRDLLPSDVRRFVESMKRSRQYVSYRKEKRRIRKVSWKDSTASAFLRTLKAVLRWGVQEGMITVDPLAKLRVDGIPSRGVESIITPEQHALILADCRSPNLRDLLIALEHTGARPGELFAASGRDWHDGEQAIIYYADVRRGQGRFRHKSSRYKDRIIRFTGAALDMIRRRVREHGNGLIFGNEHRGEPYSHMALSPYFRKLRKVVGNPHLSPYSYRHTFATKWLLAGRSIDILAQLLGNSPQTIRLHYAHLCGEREAIRRQLEAFIQGENNDRTTAEQAVEKPSAAAAILEPEPRSSSEKGNLPEKPQ